VDVCRFDAWTRRASDITDRRTTVKALASGVAAFMTLARGELGLAQDDVTGDDRTCKVNSAKCKKDKECCSYKCKVKGRKRKATGKCQCTGQGARCQRDNGCCSGICRNESCDCGDKGDFCNNDSDCCSRRCDSGKCRCGQRGDRCDQGRGCCSGSCGGDGFCK
jgi:hypothetical protein